jgi:hypothetical protein
MDDDLSTTYSVPLAGSFSAWSTERLEIHREGLIAVLLFLRWHITFENGTYHLSRSWACLVSQFSRQLTQSYPRPRQQSPLTPRT